MRTGNHSLAVVSPFSRGTFLTNNRGTMEMEGSDDRLTISNWLDGAPCRIEQITFDAAGTQWTARHIQERLMAPSDSDDYLYALKRSMDHRDKEATEVLRSYGANDPGWFCSLL